MRKQFEQEAKHIKVKVNWIGKFMCGLLTVWSMGTMLIFIAFFINFQRDFPYLLKINMHENGFFDICETLRIECQPYSVSTILIRTVFNIFLICTFWIQHVMMSKLSFKLLMIKLLPEYIIIERPMFVLASQLTFILAFSLWQPIDLVLANFLDHSLFIDIIGAIGGLIFVKSLYDLNDVADLMGWKFMKTILNSKEISFNSKYLPKDTTESIRVSRIYRMCRHPMQLGTIIIILSGGKIWSISRVIYSVGLIVGINIGISYEEIRLLSLYDSYRQYKEKVQFRLIPNIFALFATDDNTLEQDKEEDAKKK